MITAIVTTLCLIISLRSQRKLQKEKHGLERQLAEEQRQFTQQLENKKIEQERSLEEMKLSYGKKWNFIYEWQKSIANEDIRILVDSAHFTGLETHIDSPARAQLVQLKDEYDRHWENFIKEEEPRLRKEFKENYFHGQNMLKSFGITPANLSELEISKLCQEYIQQERKHKRKELGEHLRRFLYQQLELLITKWELI